MNNIKSKRQKIIPLFGYNFSFLKKKSLKEDNERQIYFF